MQDPLPVDHQAEEFQAFDADVLSVLPRHREACGRDVVVPVLVPAEPAVEDQLLPGVEPVPVGLHQDGRVLPVCRGPLRLDLDPRLLRSDHPAFRLFSISSSSVVFGFSSVSSGSVPKPARKRFRLFGVRPSVSRSWRIIFPCCRIT